MIEMKSNQLRLCMLQINLLYFIYSTYQARNQGVVTWQLPPPENFRKYQWVRPWQIQA